VIEKASGDPQPALHGKPQLSARVTRKPTGWK
jgi:hypothetical protein